MQEQKLLTLRWCSFLRDSSDIHASIFTSHTAYTLIMYHRDHVFFFDDQTDKTKNHQSIVDAHFQDGWTSMSLSFLLTKTAITMTLEGCDYAAVGVQKM